MRGVTNLLLFNMALSDLLSTVFFVPWAIAKEISPISWPLGDFMCRAPPVIASVSVSVSVYSMLALAVERYLSITRDLKHATFLGHGRKPEANISPRQDSSLSETFKVFVCNSEIILNNVKVVVWHRWALQHSHAHVPERSHA